MHPDWALGQRRSQPTVSAIGTRTLIYFRVRFADDRDDPVSVEEAVRDLTEAQAIFQQNSRGRFGLTWEVSPVLQLAVERSAFAGPGGFERFLTAVREAGLAAGIDYQKFDLDVARHSGVPGFAGGNANLGARGAQVQAGGGVLLSHELGHNLGLLHANAWMTGNPGISRGSPPLPSNYETLPEPRDVPVYPDSQMGHETVTGPGRSAEYGDINDIMGSGSSDFSALNRYALGWLAADEIAVLEPGWHALSLQSLEGGIHPALPRAIQIGPTVTTPLGDRQYWVQLAPKATNGVAAPGIQIRWADPVAIGLGSLVLAPLASEMPLDGGVTLTAGRTFSDFANGVHLTLRQWVGEGDSQVAEVLVAVGFNADNQAPLLALDPLPAAAEVGEELVLTARALDSNGDTLVWHWDFGDGTSSTVPGTVTKTWRRKGDFRVVVEVSDGKGGVARAQSVVRVGAVDTRRITGRVVDPTGRPVAGVRVHNGVLRAVGGGRSLATTLTDSEGRYILTGLVPGTYTNGAYHLGYSVRRLPPVAVEASDLNGLDFVAVPLPEVQAEALSEVPESAGYATLFKIKRSGAVDAPLTVFYRLVGTASAGSDYVRPLVDRVVIPAGSSEVSLALDLFDDGVAEGDETIRLEIQAPTQAIRVDPQGNLYTVYYPGWEYLEVDGLMQWVLTEPSYLPVRTNHDTVVVRDNDVAREQIVSVTADDLIAIEQPIVEGHFRIAREGATELPLEVHLQMGGTATAGVDYTALPGVVRFHPGETEQVLVVQPIDDGIAEPEEAVDLEVVLRPEYAVAQGIARVRLRDSGEVTLRLDVRQRADGLLELVLKGKPGSRVILDRSEDFRAWTPVRTNFLFNSDTAAVLLSPTATASGFFRTRLESMDPTRSP
ncbi:MAG: carboxypeptidase regulatory-like domain-containing protein [Verrucomicrobiales bacterium]|nr:carboxypeptidase regulatory-like domain-containing protein [Verrucomicrobiales bacterium]